MRKTTSPSSRPTLETLVELNREYAEYIDPDKDPYEVLFEEYEPYLGIDTAEETLEQLRDELVPLIDAVRESDVDLSTPFKGTYDAEIQEELSRDVLDTLGYDWDRGRLDTAPHPFSSGNQFDARVTTRFDESDPLGALMSTVHEFGHATYTQGLPDEQYGTPLGESRDLTVHESQSRVWENNVGRSRAFWENFLPLVKERFSDAEDVSVEEMYEAANRVHEDNLIRVEADELTYHMHIVVRFEIEKQLIRGEIEVDEVPEALERQVRGVPRHPPRHRRRGLSAGHPLEPRQFRLLPDLLARQRARRTAVRESRRGYRRPRRPDSCGRI